MKSIKGICLPAYQSNLIRALLSLKKESFPLPKIQSSQVLIKIDAASVNPSDLAFMQGTYHVKKSLPSILGFEGCGKVIESSSSAGQFLGRKVACFTQTNQHGTWADYMVADVDQIIPLPDDFPDEQAAAFAINPFTAVGLFDAAMQHKSPAVIINAAGSQLAHFIRHLAAENHIDVINIVRKDKVANELMDAGQKYVLVSTHDDFIKKLKNLSHELQAKVCFDAVAGDQSGEIFNAMPAGSRFIVYGGLSGQPMGKLGILPLIFDRKIIEGFYLSDWMQQLESEKKQHLIEETISRFQSGKWETKIQAIASLDEVVAGLRQYLGQMSAGKLILKP